MSKCNVTDSIDKLRDLRKRLCDQEKTWLNDALDERTHVIDGLIELQGMIHSENFSIDECRSKLKDILKHLNIDCAPSNGA